jgi:hypothetical protein
LVMQASVGPGIWLNFTFTNSRRPNRCCSRRRH